MSRHILFAAFLPLLVLAVSDLACDAPPSAPATVERSKIERAKIETVRSAASATTRKRTIVEPTLEQYIELSVLRNEWLATYWQTHRTAPSSADLESFLDRAGWTAEFFHEYGSAHADAVQSYLRDNPATETKLSHSSQRIRTVVESMEVRP